MATPRRDMKKQRERQAAAERRAAAKRQRMIKTFSFIGVFTIVIVLIAGAFQINGNSDSASPTTTTTATPGSGTTPCPAADGSSPRTLTFPASFQMCIDPTKNYSATFDTNQGKIIVALDTKKTPKTVNNFVALARYHYYDTTTIFRTDTSIDIIQGGSPHTNSAGDKGPGYNIDDEGDGFQYSEGDLVMARSEGPNSAGAQFFFATGPKVANLNSQGTYVTFGRTSQGLDVLKKIIALHTDTGGNLGGAPRETVTVNSVTITES